jgi:hypothetical protein
MPREPPERRVAAQAFREPAAIVQFLRAISSPVRSRAALKMLLNPSPVESRTASSPSSRSIASSCVAQFEPV